MLYKSVEVWWPWHTWICSIIHVQMYRYIYNNLNLWKIAKISKINYIQIMERLNWLHTNFDSGHLFIWSSSTFTPDDRRLNKGTVTTYFNDLDQSRHEIRIQPSACEVNVLTACTTNVVRQSGVRKYNNNNRKEEILRCHYVKEIFKN